MIGINNGNHHYDPNIESMYVLWIYDMGVVIPNKQCTLAPMSSVSIFIHGTNSKSNIASNAEGKYGGNVTCENFDSHL